MNISAKKSQLGWYTERMQSRRRMQLVRNPRGTSSLTQAIKQKQSALAC
jgi:hypothetical protein